jgi:hypothetical protein
LKIPNDILEVHSAVLEVRQQIRGTVAKLSPKGFFQFLKQRLVELDGCRPFHPKNIVGFLTRQRGVMTKEPTHLGVGNELKSGIPPCGVVSETSS